MQLIGGYNELLEYFGREKIFFNNSTLLQINIDKVEFNFDIDITFKLANSVSLRICFYNIKKFGFVGDETWASYYIDPVKLFQKDDLIYLSLNPDGEDEEMSPGDCNFILFRDLVAYIQP